MGGREAGDIIIFKDPLRMAILGNMTYFVAGRQQRILNVEINPTRI